MTGTRLDLLRDLREHPRTYLAHPDATVRMRADWCIEYDKMRNLRPTIAQNIEEGRRQLGYLFQRLQQLVRREGMKTMQEIQTQYPTPVTDGQAAELERGTCYCVGGAAMLAHGIPTCGFPEEQELAEALVEINPALPRQPIDVAYSYASAIIYENDYGRFATAWEALAEALAYPHPGAQVP